MLRILESQAPAKQTATDTISTLSSRLSSATLLEDRRAAILGLRSFAKQYPASVASGALRDLIAGLRRDGEDPDTLKVVLETLLMLFSPDENSPEASEDISLWLADEFTTRQDNVTALLDLLTTGEFYLRLYSLQILSQVCIARPQRAQEVIISAPLGVSRITSVLDDKREAVRNEALLLLVALTPSSAELQKIVAFEDAFNRIFNLIDLEGGLTHGSTTVQDCLSLLSNLLKLNPSNQAYFREIGCVNKVAKLLAQVIKEEESAGGVSEWVRPQRDINLWGTLTVLQLFLVRRSQGIIISQEAFWRSGVLQRVLQIAFHQTFGSNVRARALETCADVIRANSALQEQFGDLAVPAVKQSQPVVNGRGTPKASSVPSGTSTPAANDMSNVIESLLELTLDSTVLVDFGVRLAACNCTKAFFDGHSGIRGHVLRRAIEGHKSGDDTVPNILTVLLEPPNTRANSDAYQQWMAAVLLMHLLVDNGEAKEQALKVSENEHENEHDNDEEYEVVSFVQSITSNIVAGVQHPEDERALIGYLMMLSIWLFEDPAAVNDLLGEGSTIQGLISAVKVASPTMPLVAGLCSFLLGIIYEFSTKDSPIARAKLYDIILKGLSREIYLDRLTKLRESPYIRDFEVMPIFSGTGSPEVYFDQMFVEFFKDNYSRFLRAIDREPGFEVSILANGVQKGVSRELVDSLRAQLDEQKVSMEKAESELVLLRQRLEQEELEHRRTRDSTSVELGRIKHINQSLQSNHEEELQTAQQETASLRSTLTSTHEATLAQLRKEQTLAAEQSIKQHKAELDYVEQRRKALERELARTKENLAKQQGEAEKGASQAQHIQNEQQREIEALHKNLKIFEDQLVAVRKEHEAEMRNVTADLEDKAGSHRSRADDLEKQMATVTANHGDSQRQILSLQTKFSDSEKISAEAASTIKTLSKDLESSQEERKKLQNELETLQKELLAARKAVSEQQPLQQNTQISPKELESLRSSAAKQKDTQTELDDLLVVFADLEAKRTADKQRLKELGEEVSEDEDEGEGDDEDDEEEEDE